MVCVICCAVSLASSKRASRSKSEAAAPDFEIRLSWDKVS